MNAAVRAVVRMGIYLGCKVYFIKEGYQGKLIDFYLKNKVLLYTAVPSSISYHWNFENKNYKNILCYHIRLRLNTKKVEQKYKSMFLFLKI